MERVEMIKKKLLNMTQDNDTTPWRTTMAQNATKAASKYPSEESVWHSMRWSYHGKVQLSWQQRSDLHIDTWVAVDLHKCQAAAN